MQIFLSIFRRSQNDLVDRNLGIHIGNIERGFGHIRELDDIIHAGEIETRMTREKRRRQPSSANRLAMAAPMPDPAPVIRTVSRSFCPSLCSAREKSGHQQTPS
ncbi:hypothetical protein [Brucella oryzae]|uniref:hypothetical protein n=1 Tax=Brucella oryzae TaxID=335286 RepID=UPI001ABF1842|nr:hypothetical protein [Brucella oryzae]